MFAPTQENPWPFDMVVEGTEVLLVPNDEGEILATKANTLSNVVPDTYDLSSYPLHAERPLPMERFRFGMGLTRQDTGFPKRYAHGLFIDTSIDGLTGKGPHFRTQTGVAGAPGRVNAMALDAGVTKEFGAFGQYVYKRNGDAAGDWALSRDFGAGRTVTDLQRFKNRGGTVVDGLYATTDNGTLWQYDGAAWNSCTLPAGFVPTQLEVGDEDMFLFGGNELRSVTADPTLAANYSGPVYVGDASALATGLKAVGERLVAFKEDGPYGVTGLAGTLEVNALMPELRGQRAATNGRNAAAFKDALWFRHGDALWKMHFEGEVAVYATVGLSVLMDNESAVRGSPVAFAGHGNWFGYFVVVNGTDSYLCKWGTWLNPQETDQNSYVFLEVPHGALFKWTGKTVTHMWVSNVAGATANERLYVMFSDGSVHHALLPKGTPNPYAAGSGCEFTITDGELHFAEVHADFPTETKNWRGVTVLARSISADNAVRHFYRLSGAAGWNELEQIFSLNAQRIFFPDNTGSKNLQQYAVLVSTDVDSCPLIEGWHLHYSVVPDLIFEYTGAVDARHFRARRDGVADTRDPSEIREALRTAVRSVGAVECTLPDGTQAQLNFYEYAEQLPNKWKRFGLEWLLPFKAVEYRVLSTYGTHRRMMQYTHGELMQLKHSQIQTL
jgi:hypothetical protein